MLDKRLLDAMHARSLTLVRVSGPGPIARSDMDRDCAAWVVMNGMQAAIREATGAWPPTLFWCEEGADGHLVLTESPRLRVRDGEDVRWLPCDLAGVLLEGAAG